MTFLAAPDREKATKDKQTSASDDEDFSDSTLDDAQTDEHLQTGLAFQPLQTRLLKLFYDGLLYRLFRGVTPPEE